MTSCTPAKAFGSMSTLAPMWGIYDPNQDDTTPKTYQMCVLVSGTLTPKCFGNINETSYAIQAPPANTSFLALSAGAQFTCGLIYGSQVPFCWGNNDSLLVPAQYRDVRYSSIASGAYHVCALRANSGSIDCWGQNSSGECDPPAKEWFTLVTSGWGFSCGLTNHSKAICWGDVANKNFTHNLVLPRNTFFEAIFAGRSHICGVEKTTGKTICWGDNTYSQSSPPPYFKFKTIAPGMYHTCGLLEDSTAVCWGDNEYDQLNATLVGVAFSTIASGDVYTCGIRLHEPTRLKCWGNVRTAQADLGQVMVAATICSMNVCGKHQRQLPSVCPGMLYKACVECTPETCKKDARKRKIVVIVLTIAGFIALVVCFIFLLRYSYRKRGATFKEKEAEHFDPEFAEWEDQAKRVKAFTLDELRLAANNFSDDMVIGKGAFGMVYKARLPDGKTVALKRGKLDKKTSFGGELILMSRLHHTNLVNLVGYCKEELLLVFEYMANGSLYDCLFTKNIKLDWLTRLKIAIQSAHGLEYLHMFADPNIIHRDVKSANILLDEDFNAHVADFGVSTLGPSEDVTHVTSTSIVGTPGYVDPEYFQTMQLSSKSDVYSFGIVLLELFTGKKAVDLKNITIGIVAWVKKTAEQSSLSAVLDSSKPVPDGCEKILVEVLELALRCVGPTARERPTMSIVANSLNKCRKEFHAATKEWPSSSCTESTSGPSTLEGTSPLEISFSESFLAEFQQISPK